MNLNHKDTKFDKNTKMSNKLTEFFILLISFNNGITSYYKW